MAFDPDAFLAKEFDPDAFLASQIPSPMQADIEAEAALDVVPRETIGEQAQPEGISAAGQAILDIPGGAAISEFASAVNRGVVNILDFVGPEQINNVLQLIGSKSRVPTLKEQPIVQEAITGEFMEPGLARQAVRTAGEFVGPTGATGAVIRGAAAQIPKVAPQALTTGQRVLQSMTTPALPEVTAGAIAGAGSEVGAEFGEFVAGEEGRQYGRLIGGVLAPTGITFAKESVKTVVSKSAKKLLTETAPTIENLKVAARTIYKELDDMGAVINPKSVTKLSGHLHKTLTEKGFDASIHPKVNAALKRFDEIKGQSKSTSEIDILRRVAQSAANSTEPDEARLGSLMVGKIDDFLDGLGRGDFTKYGKDVGVKYKDARQLWRRVKKSELIQEAFSKAELQATGFENGIRNQFRSILNNKKKVKGFTKEEIKTMRAFVKGSTLQNMAKMLGKFGISEGQASNMLMGYGGIAGGAYIGGPVGAIVVPAVGQVSKKLAQKLTREGAEGADLIVRAGTSGIKIVKAYMKLTKPSERSAKELTELLLRPEISLKGLKAAMKLAPQKQKKLIKEAAFLVNTIKATQEEGLPE